MKEQKEDGKFYPLAINIKKLQAYSPFFQLDERVMFEWFMVKALSFKKEFYYSIRRIANETGIRKARLDTILRRFRDLSLISYEAKGMPKTYHFWIHPQHVMELLPRVYNISGVAGKTVERDHQFYEISKLLIFFSELLSKRSKHKEYYKNNNKEDIGLEMKGLSSVQSPDDSFEAEHSNEDTLTSDLSTAETNAGEENGDEFDFNTSDNIHEILEELKLEEAEEYKQLLITIHKERVKLHNQNPMGKPTKRYANLAYSKKNRLLLYELFITYEQNDIEASFTAFIDAILREEVNIRKPISYFLTKDHNGEFSTFHTYLDIYITKYGYIK